jgi:hypothetical protein
VTTNYFIGICDEPFHLSVGAILVNDKGEVAHHFWNKKEYKNAVYENIYLLMRETIEPNESLEQAVTRGLQEEFGVVATLETYLGSLVAAAKTTREFQKTTLYFLCNLEKIDKTL